MDSAGSRDKLLTSWPESKGKRKGRRWGHTIPFKGIPLMI
jgi:hypothetical protein